MTVRAEISMSLDGYVAGPDATLDEPLGQGGEQLHEWAFAAAAWREAHGQVGGEHNADSEVLAASLARSGATIMGRRMFSGGAGPWADDPNPNGWWGDEPPFHHPVFVLTHHARDPLALTGTTFTFVTNGLESALEQAVAGANGKDVTIGGGADVVQQYLAAGLLDELHLHVAPVLLDGGRRLLENLGEPLPTLEKTDVVETPGATHYTYRVRR